MWHLLGRVRALKLAAVSSDRHSFFDEATAAGTVAVTKPQSRMIVFEERGVWTSKNRETVDFRNVYRWSLEFPPSAIGLVHLRYGMANPVHLVDFVATDRRRMQAVQPHRCGADRYSATLSMADDGQSLLLEWVIRGPLKDDRLLCTYLPG